MVRELGFDDCIDYKQHRDAASLYRALKSATPDGIHGHFENVGGAVLDAALARMNDFGRIALCGMIAGYDGQPIPMSHPALILTSRLRVEGFIVSEHLDVWPEALAELGPMAATGALKVPRDNRQGARVGSRGLSRHAQGPELRQAVGAARLTCGAAKKSSALRKVNPRRRAKPGSWALPPT